MARMIDITRHDFMPSGNEGILYVYSDIPSLLICGLLLVRVPPKLNSYQSEGRIRKKIPGIFKLYKINPESGFTCHFSYKKVQYNPES